MLVWGLTAGAFRCRLISTGQVGGVVRTEGLPKRQWGGASRPTAYHIVGHKDRTYHTMTVNVGDRLRITAVLRVNGQADVMNVFAIRTGGLDSTTDEAAMENIELYLSGVYSAGTDLISGLCATVEVRGFNVTQDRPLPVVPWTHFAAGSSGGELLPFGCAALVLFRTGLNRVLGRKFIPGITEATVTHGALSVSAVNAAALWAGALAAGYEAISGDTRYDYFVENKLGVYIAPLSATIRTQIAYQRRRKPGVGV